jgi:hypothetical protein
MAALLASVYEEDAWDYSFILKIFFKMPPRNLGDLMTTIFICSSFLYLRIQPQPQPISRNATRNRRNPVGKMTAIRMPEPRATAKIPIQRQRLIGIASLFPGLLHYIHGGDWRVRRSPASGGKREPLRFASPGLRAPDPFAPRQKGPKSAGTS